MPIAEINNRVCINVTGEDAKSFLQGMITNDMNILSDQPAIYACLLTPQGKFLYDFMVTAITNGYRLEVLTHEAEALIKRLKPYKLRSKVNFEMDEVYKIYAGWRGAEKPDGSYQDPRLPELGWRFVAPLSLDTDSDLKEYDRHRVTLGVPDGSRDLTAELATLYDGNIDVLHGVAFNKGCYMGQELTARVHFRGLVKKRMYPFNVKEGTPETGSVLKSDGKKIGQVTGVYGSLGLSVVKVDAVENTKLAQTDSGATVQIFQPTWSDF